MATYNGALYIEDMLESLLAQNLPDFILRVRDDGSNDNTVQIIRDYAPRFNGRLILMETARPTGSAKGNFDQLMQAATGDYILFADQDDVWTPDHVTEIVKMLTEAEAEMSPDTPIYAFTDATPVNNALRPLAKSFFSFKGIDDPAISRKLNRTIVCTPMLGCASGINRALLNLARPVPIDRVTGHDWWALLLATAAGHCVWSMKSTVLYRLHGSNASSQVASRFRTYSKFTNKTRKVRRGMMLRRQQAVAVRDRLQGIACAKNLAILEEFDQLMGKGFVSRRFRLLIGGYIYPDITRNLGMFALC